MAGVENYQVSLPIDLLGVKFRVGVGGYVDDLQLTHTCPVESSAALDRIPAVCGKISLNISVAKTEWIYLHNPSKEELLDCGSKRTTLGHCCEKNFLNGVPLRHKANFRYLGSIVSKNGGVEDDTRFRVLQAQLSLCKYNGIWLSDVKLRQEVLF